MSATVRVVTDYVVVCIRHSNNYAKGLHQGLLLEMLIIVKYMNNSHYYCDRVCPRTTSVQNVTLVTFVRLCAWR